MSRFASALGCVALLGLLASCANQQAAQTPTTSAPASSAPGSPAPASSAPPGSAPILPSSSSRPVVPPVGGLHLTLTGTVEEGVEHGCLILTDAATGLRYNLTGGNPAIVRVGGKVQVVGVIRRDVMSYCQQGAIFQVLAAKAG